MHDPFCLPVPTPEDTEALEAIRCLLGHQPGWLPPFFEPTPDHLDEASDMLDKIEESNIGVVAIGGKLYYGPPPETRLMELLVLVAWRAPMLKVLSMRDGHGDRK